MADEVQVFEMAALRGDTPLRVVPFIEKQVIDIDGAASAAFNRGTTMVTIITSIDCSVEFGAAPAGTGDTFPLNADEPYDFAVIANHKVIAVS